MSFSYFVLGPIEYCETVYYKNMRRDCVLTRSLWMLKIHNQQAMIFRIYICVKMLHRNS